MRRERLSDNGGPRARATLRPALVALALLATAAAASARPLPHLLSVRCSARCEGPHAVAPGGRVVLMGRDFTHGLKLVVSVRVGRQQARIAVATRLLRSGRLIASVPANAISGRIYLRGHRVRSNALTLKVRRPRQTAPPPHASGTAFDGNGMWIWYVSQSSGGDPNAIVAQAQAHSIATVFVKSSDGTSAWSQFSPAFVAQLKAAGLRVCAWQYVYGSSPTVEAQLGADAVQAGADCLVIDAEKEYEGRYAQAQQYIGALRQSIGPAYPVGLAGFPYVDYHPSFPYSIFLGPGGAQFDVPQVYWKDIGTSVDAAIDHAYRFNRPYGRAIDPLGQSYNGTSASDIVRFRQLAAADASTGVSWWDWQEASPEEWQAIGEPLGPFSGPPPAQDDASLGNGAQGDLVVWAQEHLRGAGQQVTVDGDYGPATEQAVSSFQSSVGLPATGTVDTATWNALLRYQPTPWGASKVSGAAAGARTGPPSARLPARRYEIPPKSHAPSGG